MNSFKGTFPKNLCSDDAISILSKRTEQFRKSTHQSSEIVSSILKVYEAYLLQLPRIMSLLYGDGETSGDPFYNVLRAIYIEIYKEYQNFTLDFIQSPTNQINNMNSNKFVSFSGCVLGFQKIVKNYASAESAAYDLAKKYFKTQKNLMSSIEAYKQSFTEAKLVYNIDEKIKRYSACEQLFKNVALDHAMVIDLKDKLEQRKNQVIEAFEALVNEDRISEEEVEIKLFNFLSRFNTNACSNLKKRLAISKEGRSKIQKAKIQNFFQDFNIHEGEPNQSSHEGRGRRNAGNLSSLGKGQHETITEMKKMYARLQKFVEAKKNGHLRVYEFHLEFYKTTEKKSLTQLKQSFMNLEKNIKKIKDQFSKQTYEEMKSTLSFVKQTMDIYMDVQKKIWVKIQAAGEYIEQMKNTLRALAHQIFSIIQKISQESKDKETIESHDYKDKLNTIYEMLKFNDMKLTPIFNSLRQIYGQILNIYELGLGDCYEKTYELGKTSQNGYEKALEAIKERKIDKLKNSPLGQILYLEYKGKISFEGDTAKNNDFKKLKKPVEIEILEKQKSNTPEKEQMQKQECANDGEDGSPPRKSKKHRQFIMAKVNFVEGEEFRSSFSCALADKIILQGRLYVTNYRLCFFSNFNPSNVFFGETFIQIPKKDIITLEKRKNGIFFDNSISITTVKGEVFLTSFFKRNEAYSLICDTIGINKEEQAYEQKPQAFESDQSSILQKTKQKDAEDPTSLQQNQQAEDDIKQDQIVLRADGIQKMMDQLTYAFKESSSAQFVFPGLTAYKLLKLMLLDGEVTIAGKKYSNIIEYFKKMVQLHKDIEISSFTPHIQEYLNPSTIKSTCPLKFSRRLSATVPTPNSNIPFVPKFTKASQKQSLYVISKHKWVLDNEVESSGAPYTDSFRVYYRTVCDSTPSSCKIATRIFIHFLKNVMVKGVIESKTHEESALQFKKQYEQIRKYLVGEQKLRKKLRIVKTDSNQSASAEKVGEQEREEQRDCITELEEQLAQAKQKSQLEVKRLKQQVNKYQKIAIVALALALVLGLALIF